MDSSRRLVSLRLCFLFSFCGEFLCHGFAEFLTVHSGTFGGVHENIFAEDRRLSMADRCVYKYYTPHQVRCVAPSKTTLSASASGGIGWTPFDTHFCAMVGRFFAQVLPKLAHACGLLPARPGTGSNDSFRLKDR